jgi:dihydroflavonol-4-reductase
VSVTLITGADSLVGAHLARQVLERGDRLRLIMSSEHADAMAAEFDLGEHAEIVHADARDAAAIGKAMRRVDTLFHVPEPAPWRSSWRHLHDVHVDATEVVLGAALKHGVSSAVHTSSATSLGPAERGSTADETQPFSARWRLSIVSATHTGERVALRMRHNGLPVVLALPGLALGAGDHGGGATEVVRAFIERRIPFYTDGALSIVGAADVARGLMLAQELGRPGERYLLSGRNFTTDRLYSDLGRLTGVEPPALRLPIPAALALAQAGGSASFGLTAQEVRLRSLWWAYRSTKARDELGWVTGHHEDPLTDTIEWYRQHGVTARQGRIRQPIGLRVAGYGVRRVVGLASVIRTD